MQSDSSSHFSVRITSSSSDIGKNEHTCRHGDQMEIDWGCPRAAAPSSPRPDRTGLLVSLHTRERAVSGDTSEGRAGLRQEGRGRWCCWWWRWWRWGGEHFEAIGGDVRFAQTQEWCLNMLPTNMAAVSLSSSLFSVTMYNPASSPRLLTMSFHIMLPHTRSCTQQAVTQLLCLRVRPSFFFFSLFFFYSAINAHGACVKATGGGGHYRLFPSGSHWKWKCDISHRRLPRL